MYTGREIVQKWYLHVQKLREAKHAVRDSGKNRQESAIYVLAEADYIVAKETHVYMSDTVKDRI